MENSFLGFKIIDSSVPIQTQRLLEQIEKFKQGAAYRVSHGLWHGTEVTAEQLVVPSEHLVDENIAVSVQPAESGGGIRTRRGNASSWMIRVVRGSTTVLGKPASPNSVGWIARQGRCLPGFVPTRGSRATI